MQLDIRQNETLATAKKLWKPFIVVFAVSYMIFNWNSISWLFNYKVAKQYASDVLPVGEKPGETSIDLTPVPRQESAETGEREPSDSEDALVIDGSDSSAEEEEPEEPPAQEKPEPPKKPAVPATRGNTISIPKIGITAPVVATQSTDNNVLHSLLDKGVILYPDSAGPGNPGQTTLLGHSAPPGWPKIKYDWVFTRINELKAGDAVNITYNGRTYSYTVIKSYFVNRGEALQTPDGSKSTVSLVTCWPPGKDVSRIVVETVLND